MMQDAGFCSRIDSGGLLLGKGFYFQKYIIFYKTQYSKRFVIYFSFDNLYAD